MDPSIRGKVMSGDSTIQFNVLERRNIDDNTELVLCDRGSKFPAKYATWIRDRRTGATKGGRYFRNLFMAAVDFDQRTVKAALRSL